jgi:hypothetical protein
MQHLNEEQLIAHRYHDADALPEAAEHLAECADCRAQFDTLCAVLTLVDQLPVPERADGYGEQVWNRLRWRLERRRRRTWQSIAAVAAVLAVAFFAGQLWHARIQPPTSTPIAAVQPINSTTQQLSHSTAPAPTPNDRVLVFVVSDHLDDTSRMLTELANADPKKSLDISSERNRAGELVASNRIYRQTATRRGDTRIASLLSDIEPILIELSHAGAKLTPAELTQLQKRIDSKGLLFKVRVMTAQPEGRGTEVVPAAQRLNSL